MKKLLLLGVVSLTTMSLAAGQASAWFWDHLCCHCEVNCTYHYKYRPYNAFDPGCPYGCGMPGCGPCWVPPPAECTNNAGSSCFNSGCCDAGCLPDSEPRATPSAPATPATPVPTTPAPAPGFTPPMPTPLPSSTQMFRAPMPQNAGNVSGYYGNYAPGYFMNTGAGQYPMQRYAPQGYAPQGYAPQGYAPQGYAPQGYAPQGYAPQGYAPQGYAPQGYAPQGYAPQGYAPQGMYGYGMPYGR
jgi:hypothetical protein